MDHQQRRSAAASSWESFVSASLCPAAGLDRPRPPPHARPASSQRRRKKVDHACVFCQRSHMTCDEGRPCQRCIKRRIGHLCHDLVAQQSVEASLAEGLSQPLYRCAPGPFTAPSPPPREAADGYEEWDLPEEEAYCGAGPTINFLDCDELCTKLGLICEEL